MPKQRYDKIHNDSMSKETYAVTVTNKYETLEKVSGLTRNTLKLAPLTTAEKSRL